MATRSEIGRIASARTKKQFADELSRHTTLTATEVKTLFPKKSDRESLMNLIEIINSDTDENQKIADITKKVGNVSGIALKLMKKLMMLS